MDDMKRIFSTPKKAAVSVICMIVVIAAVSIVAVKSSLISKAEAEAAALKDAGLGEAEASALRTRLEFDDGRFQYEVDFYNNGTEYEYLIQAKDGDIIARDIEGGKDSGQLPEAAENQPAAGAQSQQKSPDEAKAAALEDAGLSETDVTFKKTELDHSHGMQVYEIEFYTSDTEYDYEISASDGTVLEKSVEQFQIQAALSGNTADGSDNHYIGVDHAKETALSHAGLNESDVQFTKAKLENDDGRVEYESEIYSGRTEYDNTIDAVSGNMIEYDVDYD